VISLTVMPLDYSKWDHLDDYESSDNEDEAQRPRVIRLDAPSRVTFGGGGGGGGEGDAGVTIIEPSPATAAPASPSPPNHAAPVMVAPHGSPTTAPSTTRARHEKAVGVGAAAGDGRIGEDGSSSSRLATATTHTHCPTGPEQHQHPSAWTERGGCLVIATTTATTPPPSTLPSSSCPSPLSGGGAAEEDGHADFADVVGGRRRRLYWSQDRYSVHLRLELHEHEHKVHSVEVAGILPYSDRFAAVTAGGSSASRPRLLCRGVGAGPSGTAHDDDDGPVTTTSKKQKSSPPAAVFVLLEGDLPHPVHLAEGEDEVDWSIEREEGDTSSSSSPGRFLFVNLWKAVPMRGVFVWWRRPLMQFPEVDVEHVRKTIKNGGDSSGGTTSTSSVPHQDNFVNAWEEAHRMFREKRKNQQDDI
jgi:hypothetical protein